MQWMAAAWRRLSGREGRRLWSRQSQSLASRLVRQVARRSAGAPAGVPCVGVRSTQRAVVAIGQRLAFSLALGALLHVWCRWFLDGLLLAWAPDLCPQWRRKTFGESHTCLSAARFALPFAAHTTRCATTSGGSGGGGFGGSKRLCHSQDGDS